MTEKPALIRFHAPLTRRLRRLGLQGKQASVTLSREGIGVHGETSGDVLLSFAEVVKLRAGVQEGGKSIRATPYFRIWLRGDSKPLDFWCTDRSTYGAFLRATVAYMLRAQPAIPIETGLDAFTPRVLIGVFSLLSLASAGFAIHLALEGEDWTLPLGGLAVSLVMLAVTLLWMLPRHRRRKVTQVEQIERALPGC